jgi:hypothetical protein
MGGVSSYRKEVFEKQQFSNYFEGYGFMKMLILLEGSKNGKTYLNTAAQLYHYHDVQGRPNQYQYGKNGAKWLVCLASENPDPKWSTGSSGMPLLYC